MPFLANIFKSPNNETKLISVLIQQKKLKIPWSNIYSYLCLVFSRKEKFGLLQIMPCFSGHVAKNSPTTSANMANVDWSPGCSMAKVAWKSENARTAAASTNPRSLAEAVWPLFWSLSQDWDLTTAKKGNYRRKKVTEINILKRDKKRQFRACSPAYFSRILAKYWREYICKF